jgi:pantothenate kinase-related protein Tda10
MTPGAQAAALAPRILAAAEGRARVLVALAGPPGAGKSTLAAALAAALPGARVVPMDGFHLDYAVVDAGGLRARKGAPETFDLPGFRHLLTRLRAEAEVAIPVFDRAADMARAGAAVVAAADRILIVDWSAASGPTPARPAADAIWIGAAGPAGPESEQYHRTRAAAGAAHAEACTPARPSRLGRGRASLEFTL